jgi:NitT/TauT family transport system substrate-binding protein
MSTENTTIDVLPTTGVGAVFCLPERVAIEDGLFVERGLDVQVVDQTVPPEGIDGSGSDALLQRFEQRRQDAWNRCEWGCIYRVEQAERPARISYLRPAVVAQAILSFDDEIQEPHDLADVPVGLHKTTGQHYGALHMLEGTLRQEQVVVEHVAGCPWELIDKAGSGEYRAVTLMEPFLSVILEQGGHLVASRQHRGGQIFGEDIPEAAVRAYVEAIDAAVDIVNADPERDRRYVAEAADGAIAPARLRSDFYRYRHAQVYTEERFNDSYEWLKSWDLVRGDKSYESLVGEAVVA